MTRRDVLSKVPEVTLVFWIVKIAATTLGETVGSPQRLGRRPIARVIFCIADGQMVLLHGFIKKSQKTPNADLELALRRKKEIA
jgi:phage-related protein